MQRRKTFVTPFGRRQGPIKPNRAQRNKTTYTYRKNTRRNFTPSGFDSDKKLQNHIDSLKKNTIARQKDSSFGRLAPFIEEKKKKDYHIRTKVGVSFKIGPITPPNNGVRQKDSTDDTKIVHDVTVKALVLASDPAQEYRRKIETGRPTSKALLRAAKENGKTSRILFDSYNSAVTDGYHFTRKQLTFGTGFNQRGFTVLGVPAFMNYGDVLGVVDATVNTGPSVFKMQTLLAGIMSSKTEMLIRNQSAYLTCDVKVHLVSKECGEFNDPTEDFNKNVSHTDVNAENLPAELRNRRLPVIYQYSSNVYEAGSSGLAEYFPPSRTLSFDTTTKGNILSHSPHFKENYNICGTVTQKLGPGDFFRFSHVHHYGSGFDMANVYAAKAPVGLTDPEYAKETSYFYIVEYKGRVCEATYNNNGQYEARIGTAPVILNTEIRKSVTFANVPTSGVDQSNSGISPRCLVRVFEQSSVPVLTSARRDFNLNLNQWTVAATPAADTFVIQVGSDKTIRTETHSAGNTNATDIVP